MTTPFETDCLGLVGRSLSVPEKSAITISLKVLAQKQGVNVRFWGKVQGYHGDYVIAQTVPAGLLDARVSFFSVDGGTNWAPLAELTEEQIELCEQLRGPIMGQPEYVYKLQKDIPPEPEVTEEVAAAELPAAEEVEEGDDDEEGEEKEDAADAVDDEEAEEGEEKKPAKRRPKFQILSMPETARLAHFIVEHDKACSLVVRGAFLKNSRGEIVRNRTFSGLDVPSASELRNYFKLKGVSDSQICRQLYGPNYNESHDFLTPITVDRPEGVWSQKYDPSTGVVTLQNLYFEGSLFCHKAGTTQTAQLYFGNGQRNLDMCFMLP